MKKEQGTNRSSENRSATQSSRGRRSEAKQPVAVVADRILRLPNGRAVPTQSWGESHNHQI